MDMARAPDHSIHFVDWLAHLERVHSIYENPAIALGN